MTFSYALEALRRRFDPLRKREVAFALLAGLAYFTVLAAYYLLKTTREPLVLASGGALLKSASTGVQALVLAALLPAYGFLAHRWPLRRMVLGIGLGVLACVVGFATLAGARIPALGAAFYVFTGLFGVFTVAQLGAVVADASPAQAAVRVVPAALVGATVGGIAGSSFAALLYGHGLGAATVMLVAAALFAVHLALVAVLPRGEDRAREAPVPLTDGLALLASRPALLLLSAFVLVLNVINTNGELVLADGVRREAERALGDALSVGAVTDPSAFMEAEIGRTYGRFFTGVNLATVALQLLFASSIARRFGTPALLILPALVALGAYGIAATGAVLSVLAMGKTLENATDYSLGATGRTLFWVDRAADERIVGKPVVDTLVVRVGDLLAAGCVSLGTAFGLSAQGFAWLNLALALGAIALGIALARRMRSTSASRSALGLAELEAGQR